MNEETPNHLPKIKTKRIAKFFADHAEECPQFLPMVKDAFDAMMVAQRKVEVLERFMSEYYDSLKNKIEFDMPQDNVDNEESNNHSFAMSSEADSDFLNIVEKDKLGVPKKRKESVKTHLKRSSNESETEKSPKRSLRKSRGDPSEPNPCMNEFNNWSISDSEHPECKENHRNEELKGNTQMSPNKKDPIIVSTDDCSSITFTNNEILGSNTADESSNVTEDAPNIHGASDDCIESPDTSLPPFSSSKNLEKSLCLVEEMPDSSALVCKSEDGSPCINKCDDLRNPPDTSLPPFSFSKNLEKSLCLVEEKPDSSALVCKSEDGSPCINKCDNLRNPSPTDVKKEEGSNEGSSLKTFAKPSTPFRVLPSALLMENPGEVVINYDNKESEKEAPIPQLLDLNLIYDDLSADCNRQLSFNNPDSSPKRKPHYNRCSWGIYFRFSPWENRKAYLEHDIRQSVRSVVCHLDFKVIILKRLHTRIDARLLFFDSKSAKLTQRTGISLHGCRPKLGAVRYYPKYPSRSSHSVPNDENLHCRRNNYNHQKRQKRRRRSTKSIKNEKM